MFLLPGNVIAHGFPIGGTDGKDPITCLPGEVLRPRITLFDPDRRRPLELLDPIRLGNRAAMTGKDMDVVFHASHENGWTFELSRGAAKPCVHFRADDWVAEERPTVFGGENEVKIND